MAVVKPGAKPAKKKPAKGKNKSTPVYSNSKKPDGLTVTEWQTALRFQMAIRSAFTITNIGDGLVFSDYKVYNCITKNNYKVALRSKDNSLNFCSCYDFKTNQLGTCKHIESVLLKLNKKPALKKALSISYQPAYSSMYIEYRGERKVMFRIGADDAAAYTKLLKPYLDKDSSLNAKGWKEIDKIMQQAFKINTSFRCYEDALAFIIQQRDTLHRKALFAPKLKAGKLPIIKSLLAKPFPYQVEGILFCAIAGRSILADDMGLGKTIQAIGVAQLMHETLQVQKVLIICPTSLKYQWQTEIEKFSTSQVKVIEGNYLKRRAMYQEEGHLYKVVSYHMAVNDVDLINQYQPDIVILDEAQRIKNWQTKVSQTIKKINSKYALVLTGTPLENKLQELYSLVQFINPLQLGSLYQFISQHEQVDEAGKVVGYKNLHTIKERLQPLLLRRTKKQVMQQLPARMEKNLFVEITKEQMCIHNDYKDAVNRLVDRWRKTGYLSEEDRQKLMIYLNTMRMVCNSTYILDQQTNYQTKLDELFNILEELVNTGDEKIVIFSQWERFTRLIAKELDRLEIGYANLNGQVPSQKRKALFDRFTNDSNCRIFLSTDAGGVGLNLQAGSYLFNMDLPWNPAVLEQRIARIYRHGQKRNVTIVNFVAQHTIEHSMLGKLKFKTALRDGILDNGESNIFVGDSKFNVFMQSVEALVETDPLVEQVNTKEKNTAEEDLDQSLEKNTAQQKPVDSFDNDDDIEPMDAAGKQIPLSSDPATSNFLTVAGSFFSQLTSVLSNTAATENLVKTITRKDESNGQTYLQIPVENEAVVKNVVNLLAGLLKGLGSKN